MKLTHTERLRRAVKEARRRADMAHTAIFKTRRAYDAVDEVVKDMMKGGMAPTIRTFVEAETKRQREQAVKAENEYYHVMCDSADLLRLLGGEE